MTLVFEDAGTSHKPSDIDDGVGKGKKIQYLLEHL